MNVAYTISTIATAFALYVFIVDFLIPNHNAKIKAKQTAKERREIESLFNETPTGFLQRDCKERCYTHISN